LAFVFTLLLGGAFGFIFISFGKGEGGLDHRPPSVSKWGKKRTGLGLDDLYLKTIGKIKEVLSFLSLRKNNSQQEPFSSLPKLFS